MNVNTYRNVTDWTDSIKNTHQHNLQIKADIKGVPALHFGNHRLSQSKLWKLYLQTAQPVAVIKLLCIIAGSTPISSTLSLQHQPLTLCQSLWQHSSWVTSHLTGVLLWRQGSVWYKQPSAVALASCDLYMMLHSECFLRICSPLFHFLDVY